MWVSVVLRWSLLQAFAAIGSSAYPSQSGRYSYPLPRREEASALQRKPHSLFDSNKDLKTAGNSGSKVPFSFKTIAHEAPSIFHSAPKVISSLESRAPSGRNEQFLHLGPATFKSNQNLRPVIPSTNLLLNRLHHGNVQSSSEKQQTPGILKHVDRPTTLTTSSKGDDAMRKRTDPLCDIDGHAISTNINSDKNRVYWPLSASSKVSHETGKTSPNVMKNGLKTKEHSTINFPGTLKSHVNLREGKRGKNKKAGSEHKNRMLSAVNEPYVRPRSKDVIPIADNRFFMHNTHSGKNEHLRLMAPSVFKSSPGAYAVIPSKLMHETAGRVGPKATDSLGKSTSNSANTPTLRPPFKLPSINSKVIDALKKLQDELENELEDKNGRKNAGSKKTEMKSVRGSTNKATVAGSMEKTDSSAHGSASKGSQKGTPGKVEQHKPGDTKKGIATVAGSLKKTGSAAHGSASKPSNKATQGKVVHQQSGQGNTKTSSNTVAASLKKIDSSAHDRASKPSHKATQGKVEPQQSVPGNTKNVIATVAGSLEKTGSSAHGTASKPSNKATPGRVEHQQSGQGNTKKSSATVAASLKKIDNSAHGSASKPSNKATPGKVKHQQSGPENTKKSSATEAASLKKIDSSAHGSASKHSRDVTPSNHVKQQKPAHANKKKASSTVEGSLKKTDSLVHGSTATSQQKATPGKAIATAAGSPKKIDSSAHGSASKPSEEAVPGKVERLKSSQRNTKNTSSGSLKKIGSLVPHASKTSQKVKIPQSAQENIKKVTSNVAGSVKNTKPSSKSVLPQQKKAVLIPKPTAEKDYQYNSWLERLLSMF